MFGDEILEDRGDGIFLNEEGPLPLNLPLYIVNQSNSKTKLVFKIIVLGVLVHVLVIMATLNINFSSPVGDTILPEEDISPPLSKRVVLFVGTGLSAEAFYDTIETKIPSLNNILTSKSCWGISLTRRPIQSESGYIAMLTGRYENPSAVFTGWISDPVSFDNVLLQSQNVWIWGRPDILSIFTNDVLAPKVEYETSVLDTPFFMEFITLLTKSERSKKIKEPKSIYLLQLSGTDTANKEFIPSWKRVGNDKVVENIAEIVNLFDKRMFKDNATTYIFTSDNGLTDQGYHGSESEVEMRTPFVAWGAGIKQCDTAVTINQVDIAPFISSLLGINIPVSSLGVAPYKCLDTSNENLKNIIMKNIKQLMRIYEMNFNRIKSRKPGHEVYDERLIFLKGKIDGLLQSVVTDKKGLSAFIDDSLDTMRLLLEGIDHYNYYYRLIVLIFVAFGLLMWLIHLLIMTLSDGDVLFATSQNDEFKISTVLTTTLGFGTTVMSFFWFADYPWTYIIYMMFPVLMLTTLMLESRRLIALAAFVVHSYYWVDFISWKKTCCVCLFPVFAMILGFKGHPAWFSLLLFLQLYWLHMSGRFFAFTRMPYYASELQTYMIINALLAAFPAVSLQTSFQKFVCFIAGFLVLSFTNWRLIAKVRGTFPVTRFILFSFKLQNRCFAISFIFNRLIHYGFISSIYWKVFSWILSGVPLLFIPFAPCFQLMRLTSIVFGLASFYMLMSTESEVMFMAAYISVLYLWLKVESARHDLSFGVDRVLRNAHFLRFPRIWANMGESISIENFRIASHYTCLLMIGFFGAENPMNLNFFEPLRTWSFVTVYNPYTMSALVLLKIMIPLIITTCFFRGILITVTYHNTLAIFCYIIFIADCCLLYCMFSVKTVGSLFDIYSSISHFAVMGMFIILILLLYGVAYLLTSVYIHECRIKSALKYLKIFDSFDYRNYFLDDDYLSRGDGDHVFDRE